MRTHSVIYHDSYSQLDEREKDRDRERDRERESRERDKTALTGTSAPNGTAPSTGLAGLDDSFPFAYGPLATGSKTPIAMFPTQQMVSLVMWGSISDMCRYVHIVSYTKLDYTILCYTILHYTILHYTILYYAILY